MKLPRLDWGKTRNYSKKKKKKKKKKMKLLMFGKIGILKGESCKPTNPRRRTQTAYEPALLLRCYCRYLEVRHPALLDPAVTPPNLPRVFMFLPCNN